MSPDYRNVLIVKPSALGDIVLALPALAALREGLPGARIGWLVRPEFADLLRGHPCLDEVILFDRKRLSGVGLLTHLGPLARDLKTRRFDLVIDLQGLFRSAMLARLTGSPLRYGPANAREGATVFYTHKVPPPPNSLHLVDHYLEIVRHIGLTPGPARFVFADRAQDWDLARTLLERQRVAPDRYAVLIPGSAHGTKCWPADRFARLAEALHGDFGLQVTATGSGSEREGIERIADLAKVPLVNLAGQTDLKALVALLRHASLVVSNDTGPGHIAAGLGVPLVMLFSWSNPARIYPYGRPECMAAIDPFSRDPGVIKSRDPRHNVANVPFEEVLGKVRGLGLAGRAD